MSIYPYAQPIAGLDQIISHLRKTRLKSLDASVLKKLDIAPSNESYIINTMRALAVIDADGKTIDATMDIFLLSDEEFSSGFAKLVQKTYSGLFDLHGDDAWSQDKSKLISFFRSADKSSELIGGRQADTFIRLAGLAGKRELAATVRVIGARQTRKKSKPVSSITESTNEKQSRVGLPIKSGSEEALSLSVRVEVNLPPTSDQAVYDAIFKSIRQQLIDRE